MSISTIIQGIQGLREWYGNLNSATLTGAIDVIVVEQEDGTFLSSPFHVRFGKLGVLKAKEKIVDIEINDEPVNIHMKLDDAGAAFFVEGVPDEEEQSEIPPELATSPLPSSYFPPHWESKGKEPRANASANRSLLEAFNQEKSENDSSTSNSISECTPTNKSYKRILAEGSHVDLGQEAMEVERISPVDSSASTKEGECNVVKQTELSNTVKKKLNHKKRKRRSMNKKHTRSTSKSSIKDILEAEYEGTTDSTNNEAQPSDDIFDMDDVNDEHDVDITSTPTLTRHEILDIKIGGVSVIEEKPATTSVSVPTTPVAIVPPTFIKDSIYTPSLPSHSSLPRLQQTLTVDACLPPSIDSSNTKLASTPHNCTNENSFLSSRLPDQEQLDSMFSKPDQEPSDDSDEGNKNVSSNRNAHIQYFSDPESYSPKASPMGSRSGSPIMSDSEIMSESCVLKKTREDEGKERGEQSWEWGKLPTTTTKPQDKISKTSIEESDKTEEPKTETSTEDSGWKFLWFRGRSESSNKGTKEEDKPPKEDTKNDETQTGVTLESLKTDEDIRKYIGTHFHGNNKSHPMAAGRVNSYSQADSDADSGNGTSLPMSPHTVEETIGENQYCAKDDSGTNRILQNIDISFCGPPAKGEELSSTLFDLHKVSFDEFTMLFKMGNNPFENQDLVVRVGDQYYNWNAACPIVMSMLLYGRSFPSKVIEDLGDCIWHGQKKVERSLEDNEDTSLPSESITNDQGKHSSWWPLFGSKGSPEECTGIQKTEENENSDQDLGTAVATAFGATETVQESEETLTLKCSENDTETVPEAADKLDQIISNNDQVDNKSQQMINDPETLEMHLTHNFDSDGFKTDETTSVIIDIEESSPNNVDISTDIEDPLASAQTSESLPKTPPRIQRSEVNVSSSSEASHIDDVLRRENIFGKFKKTLRLSSDSIMALNLRPGSNEIQFSVTTAYQGTSKCRCHLYLWKSTDKIVISDIDGTITKSDVLGHILPIIGKDWAQSGVASLFTKIVNNGYHIAYLSARSIGHAAVTKDYLKSVSQGAMNLPDGPLLLNPTSLVSALHREVIIKKPEEFKIACLRDIQKLFPDNPFYCGYGNRTNDVFAYRAVGIPISRIFTINSKGELRHELTQTFQTSYVNQSTMVDHIFPPESGEKGHDCSTHAMNYSSFTYWREPVADINLHFEDETKKSDNNKPQNISPNNVTSETEDPSTPAKNN